MASRDATAKKMAAAHRRAMEVIEEHGPEEGRERLAEMMAGPAPSPRFPYELAAYQAEMMATMAEMIAELKKPSGRKKAS